MSSLLTHRAADGRPECMAYFGLLPPYTLEDVHKAYKARAREVHPDRGGSQSAFLQLQEAYEEAQAYATFLAGRRQWLSAQVEPYLQQQEIIDEVQRRGGRVVVEGVDWMNRSFGDFAVLAERLKSIELRNSNEADDLLRHLAQNRNALRYLRDLDLAGSAVSDAGLAHLTELRELRRINLARTRITESGAALLAALPELRQLNVAGTAIGWWARRRLARDLPGVSILAREADLAH